MRCILWVVAMFLAVPAARATGTIPDEWTKCTKTAECVGASNNCVGCCEDAAVNQKFAAELEKRIAADCTNKDRGHCDYKCLAKTIECSKGHCVLRTKKFQRGSEE